MNQNEMTLFERNNVKKDKKKLIVSILTAILFILVYFNHNSIQIKATTSEPDWYSGAYTNPINPFSGINLYGQCTWYAWGRAYEVTGLALPSIGNAKTWYATASKSGYEVGSQPAPHSIAVWNKGQYGHVSYVEAVDGDLVVISESNWDIATSTNQYNVEQGKKYYNGIKSLSSAEMATRYGDLLGYIYLDQKPSDPSYNEDPNIDYPENSEVWTINVTGHVNVRSGPGMAYPIVGNYTHNTKTNVYEKVIADNYTWGKTNLGWYALDFAKFINGSSNNSNNNTVNSSNNSKQPDTAAPIIRDVIVSNISSTGYTITCTVDDESKLDRVQFPTWNIKNGHSNALEDWQYNKALSGTINGTTVTYQVDISHYNNEQGNYMTHIYAYDTSQNEGSYSLPEPINVVGTDVTTLTIQPIKNQTYTGEALTPIVTVKDGTKTLKKNTDYTLQYFGNINVGTATITITGKNNYAGSILTNFIIEPASQNISGITSYKKAYGAKPFSLEITAKTPFTYETSNSGVATVSASGVVSLHGEGHATITAFASSALNYKESSKQISLIVTPKNIVIKKITQSSNKSLTMTWVIDEKATGYEIIYGANKSITKEKKVVEITSSATTKKSITNLEKGKTYYIKIRAYKLTNGKKLYGSYSPVKSIKIK